MANSAPFVPVIAVLNMKGGVGKTTISAHVFRALFERKIVSTLLLDLDPQFNLTQQLFTRDDYEKKWKSKNSTIFSAMETPSNPSLFSVSTSVDSPPDSENISRELFHFKSTNPRKSLRIVPGDFRLVKYSLMDDNGKLKTVRNRFFKFIENEKKKYGVVCIDCNPSSSFLTLCALQVCTHVLVPVKPDKYSILGLEILSEFVDNVPSISPKPQFIVALNGIPRSKSGPEIDKIEAELRGHPTFGSRTMAQVIHESSHLRAKTDYTGFASDRTGPWSSVVRAELNRFADELAKKIGL
ncbi:ParA family protein [Mesorhizobium sp. f-mel]